MDLRTSMRDALELMVVDRPLRTSGEWLAYFQAHRNDLLEIPWEGESALKRIATS